MFQSSQASLNSNYSDVAAGANNNDSVLLHHRHHGSAVHCYTQIATYRGRIFAIKKLEKKHVDITRNTKKELKMVRTVCSFI